MENSAKVWSGSGSGSSSTAGGYARGWTSWHNAPVHEYAKPAAQDLAAASLPQEDFDAGARPGANGYYCARSQFARNGILFDGVAGSDAATACATVKRLESTPAYAYGVSDLTDLWQSTPGVLNAEREIIFLRALETTIILDRLESAAGNKTFLMHTQGAPVASGSNSYVSVNGNEAVRVTTLAPAAPVYSVIDELRADQAHRLEVSTDGADGLEYFLNVVQARRCNEADLTILMTQEADYWMLTLSHPTKGSAKILLNKGRNSVGGSIGVSATARPPRQLSLLGTCVKNFQIGANGPVWGN